MKYWLLIKSGCDYPDLEDECEANSKDEAIEVFKDRHFLNLSEFDDEFIADCICEEPKTVKTDLF